jgi:phospholipid/cholesterol/gamma-HCH transport system permease protein
VKAPLIEALGFRSLGIVSHLGRIVIFAVRIARAAVTRPYRFGRLVREIFDVGVLSLAIVCASGAAVGAVLGLQGYNILVAFGAEQALGTLVGLTLVLELGPVLTALLVTGRAASAMAAEIASMVTTDQLDGLRMMSIDPVEYVVTPKAIAMILVMPLLSALFIVFGVFGGYVVGVELLGVDGGTYLTSLESNIDFADDVAQSLLKALVFGGMAGLIATYRGYISEPTAAGVSAATTGTVVVTSVSVLMVDYVITALWRAFGPSGGM